MNLQGKVAIITGASSGIGRVTAKRFAENGARVVVSARRAELLDSLVAEIGKERAVAVAGDVADEAVAARLVATAVERFGGLDIAFNNAGATGPYRPLVEISAEEWQSALATNLTGAFFCAKHQAPALVKRGGGSLIFTSTFVGTTVGFPGLGAYAAAKAGLMGLVQTLAVELGPKKVRANALLPGGTDTPANAGHHTPEMRAFIENLHGLKRLGQPEEIANAALFLASDASSFMTGAGMLVDGGVSVCRT